MVRHERWARKGLPEGGQVITWIKNMMTDETAFVGAVRAALMGLGGLQATGQFDVMGLPPWVGIMSMSAGVFIRSSSTKHKE